MIDKARVILDKWMHAVNLGNMEDVISLYDKDAILLTTFSNKFLNTPDKIQGYFERLLGYDNLSVSLHEKTLVIQPIDPERFSLCGVYCWRITIEGELMSFEARFSYVVDTALETPILHHHSSQIPRML